MHTVVRVHQHLLQLLHVLVPVRLTTLPTIFLPIPTLTVTLAEAIPTAAAVALAAAVRLAAVAVLSAVAVVALSAAAAVAAEAAAVQAVVAASAVDVDKRSLYTSFNI